jgi:Flp pilus assembly protein TadB
MNNNRQVFTISIFLLVAGIAIIYRAIVKNRENRLIFSKRMLWRTRSSISKYYQGLNEITGVRATEVLLELLMRASLLFSIILSVSRALSLSLSQILSLTLLGSSVFAWWTQGIRTRYLNKYVEEFELEFSDFVESLALAVNSGLPLISGLTRVISEHVKEVPTPKVGHRLIRLKVFGRLGGRRKENPSHSPLHRELLILQSKLEEGVSVSSAFAAVSIRLNSALLSNFTDAITLGLNRGTPLSNILSDHADSIRESQKRILLERAGRAEVKMMIPVVFLLLPISVLFALWPSFQQLQQLVMVP